MMELRSLGVALPKPSETSLSTATTYRHPKLLNSLRPLVFSDDGLTRQPWKLSPECEPPGGQ
jgi:hypothetical protein